MSKHVLSIAAKVENLAEIRSFVREAAVVLGAEPEAVTDLVLAADEVASNIMLHGYRGRGGIIELEVERQGADLIVRVRDQAPLFDPTCTPVPDLTLPPEERPLGGLGIYLARRVVDEMSHCVGTQGGNELTMIKRIESGCNR